MMRSTLHAPKLRRHTAFTSHRHGRPSKIVHTPTRIAGRPAHRLVKVMASAESDSAKTQVYKQGETEIVMPLAAVQQLPEPLQAATFFGIYAALGLGTYVSCTSIAPSIEAALPGLMAFSRATWPLLGVTYIAAGVAHFTMHDAFASMMPKQGSWGIWYLPGSPSFHVNWTGVAEVAGGVGLLLGALPPVREALPWLEPASAFSLLGLTLAVTPANIYMFTHNAPGPGPANVVIPPAGHAARGLLQVWLLATLWGVATSP
eukprot:CAMPEP_0202892918 /NCGR_PEP_ID=MMETSP1392-20130828/2589_1 /ASSEMBLY_ACC=CAM_ASM_000868 /TAXON_ID=225041 /ORGANISM="Chlamydomonas chlamydogama, Strain SAG 11-48b" /LENGTH=259 /DNA_ID=CAMNT_0049577053 /DNA_START=90 /DNA_END=869 /DNA_ORIENTATION=-